MGNVMNRLLWWHILLIGVGASLILFLILFFAVIKPKSEEVTTVHNNAVSTEGQGGTPDQVAAKDRELKKTQQDTIRINNEWKLASARYMPPITFGKDPLEGYEQARGEGVYHVGGQAYGVKDLPTVWGRWITAWYLSQWRDGIIPLVTFPIDAFPADPNEVAGLKSITFPVGGKPWAVEVQAKTFDAAMNHLKRFNAMQQHGMPVIDKVALAGQSPDLRLTYDLAIYVIPPTEPPAEDPTISGGGSGSAGAGGGPSGFGGFGSGGMGGKGMGGPSSTGFNRGGVGK